MTEARNLIHFRVGMNHPQLSSVNTNNTISLNKPKYRTHNHLISSCKYHPETGQPDRFIGIDCNATGHTAVVGIPHTGKIHKLGKSAIHTHNKYKQTRTRLQRQGELSLLKKIKNKESRIVRNINHHISKKIVEIAVSEKSGIRFENLKGIRKNGKHSRNFRYSLNFGPITIFSN